MSHHHQLMVNHKCLVDAMATFVEAVREHADVEAMVGVMPLLGEDDIGQAPPSMAITPIHGREAIEKAFVHLCYLQQVPMQPGVFAKRVAGVVHIHTQPDTAELFRQSIAHINHLKDALKASILAISPNIDTRWEVVHQALPDLAKKAAVRHWPLLAPCASKVRFAWTHRTVGGTFTREMLLAQNATARSRMIGSDTWTTWDALLEEEERILLSYPKGTLFVQKRPTRLTLMAKVLMHPSSPIKETSMHAHSPLLAINQQVSVGAFPRYDGNNRMKPPALTLVLPRKHIYLKEDPH